MAMNIEDIVKPASFGLSVLCFWVVLIYVVVSPSEEEMYVKNGYEERVVQVNQTAFMSNGQSTIKTDYVREWRKINVNSNCE